MKQLLIFFCLFYQSWALRCYNCDGSAEFCSTMVTSGWSPAQVRDARCLIAYGDGSLHIRRLTSIGDCTNPDIAEGYREEGKYNEVTVQCCQSNDCNSDWDTAGGPATDRSTGIRSDSTGSGSNITGQNAARTQEAFSSFIIMAAGLAAVLH
ncbi:hypothetical protein TCAL_16416 [Tigriopus californicus]|uniref:UPAR/Ly6 domain-containing protein n=1 Tax=Tigriopus californicus TaxID=6832 RepID=A0A553P0D0_TIGCA|nr:uncharacterized protein LOC131886931 [Tigriopus californicus]TRY71062.1 hypothetical protein TCAL_16416 [Tigriopus californicus]